MNPTKLPLWRLLTLVLVCIAFASTQIIAKPSPEQIAKFKDVFNERLDKWLSTKTNETATCLDGLVNQINQCRHAPYSQMI